MKKSLFIILLLFIYKAVFGQTSGSFNVGGDIDKFYPITFYDGGWYNNAPTNLILGRSSVHEDSAWRGSLMAVFNFHVTSWGHGSHFIDANLKPIVVAGNSFVAGWQDITPTGYGQEIIIWLRGGGTTYHYKSNYPVNPVVYDGVQNTLPFQVSNGEQLSYKSSIETYATTTGTYQNRNAYFMDNVGIGTTNPNNKLDVNGTIHSKEVKVDMLGWSDFVFKKEYNLPTLEQVEKHIKEKGHLENIPSEEEVLKKGINLGEMNAKLLQKIEELTLYAIEQGKKINAQSLEIEALQKENESFKKLSQRLSSIEEELRTKK
ncbi:hypothetical protein [Flavobacterium seoulense]|uniref:Uncharacterized protein n=1 Tax=Flavobacterium seoulense TaxID=1492738 RepID=A0A066WLH2_9FLAO|nr:hypothetical protein [Flavobacterium seoulense]KDN54716.1 hypothetical protein FEM21_22300 [Flavobacterium seoulense]